MDNFMETYLYVKNKDNHAYIMWVNILDNNNDPIYFITLDDQGLLESTRLNRIDGLQFINDYVEEGYLFHGSMKGRFGTPLKK